MSRGKKIILTAVLSIAALAGGLRLAGVEVRVNPPYEGSTAVMCQGDSYEQSGGEGWLTLLCDTRQPTRPIRVRVEDESLQKSLAARGTEEIIGADVCYSVPWQVWKQTHVPGQACDLWNEVLAADTYDQYLVLRNVFFAD